MSWLLGQHACTTGFLLIHHQILLSSLSAYSKQSESEDYPNCAYQLDCFFWVTRISLPFHRGKNEKHKGLGKTFIK